jgi:hypothetical protein
MNRLISAAEELISLPVGLNKTALLGLGLAAVVVLVRDVDPREALRYEAVRTIVWRLLDPVARKRGRPLTRNKSGHGEHITTVDACRLETLQALWNEGYRWNPLSTKKYREIDGSKRWAFCSVVWRESVSAADQHHVYLFSTGDGEVEIYGHREASVTRPDDHEGGEELIAGDPDNRLADIAGRLDG